MRTIWKIWDNYNGKMLDGSYDSKESAQEAKERIKTGRKGRKEPINLNICEAEYIVKHEYIHNLEIDLDRLEHFRNKNDEEKVQEYLNMIVSDLKRMLESED